MEEADRNVMVAAHQEISHLSEQVARLNDKVKRIDEVCVDKIDGMENYPRRNNPEYTYGIPEKSLSLKVAHIKTQSL